MSTHDSLDIYECLLEQDGVGVEVDRGDASAGLRSDTDHAAGQCLTL